jgi:hypothetical protein
MIDFFDGKESFSTPAIFESRAIFELAGYYLALPALNMAPEGDGHPVLILEHPIGNNDFATIPLRTFLTSRGYAVYEERPEMNKEAPLSSLVDGVSEKLMSRLYSLRKKCERKVSLIGWSLSGIYAREMARQAPDCVRTVITMGSPFAKLDVIIHNKKLLSEFMLGERIDKIDQGLWGRLEIPPPVPSSSIYSRTDGIVPWESCRERNDYLDEKSENIEVEGSHFGLIHNPLVIWVIADRLSQPEDRWQPFDRSGSWPMFYRDPDRDNYFSF